MYQVALEKYPNDPIGRKKFLRELFAKSMINMKKYIVCRELNIQKNSMTYVFEHIKDAVVDIIASFCDEEDCVYLESKNWTDLKYRKKLLETVLDLGYNPILIWLFFHTNYYHLENIDQQRKILMENIELFYKYYPKSMYFNTVNDLYLACPKSNPLFSISYQNRNNRSLLENYSKLLRKICPDLNYNGVPENRPKNKKIRVCFFSEFLTVDSSVLRDRLGIITKLPKDKFDIYYAAYTAPKEINGRISKAFHKQLEKNYIQLSDDIVESRKTMRRYNFDIIVYCELGMTMRPLYMSYARLAPVQITTWGHSETSGIQTVDYFVSSKYFEMEYNKAKDHYSEKLVLMNSLSTYYYQPHKLLLDRNFKFKTRRELDLDTNINLYSCIQSSFKISEDFEKIIEGILKNDRSAYIMMSYAKPYCKSQMDRLFERLGEADFQRLIFLPSMPITTYLNMIKLSDVVLDPYPFGGCNTSFEAFDFNIPVVTMPTKYLNGRFTYGMYKKMGFIDMVADSPQRYVQLAVKAGTNRQWREEIQEKINRNKILLFQDNEAIKEWSELFVKLYNEKVVKQHVNNLNDWKNNNSDIQIGLN